jgi:tetratricopeptide (TPR) repeat protein
MCYILTNIRKLKMKKATYGTVSRRHTLIIFLGLVVLTFLVLISIAGATQPAVFSDSGGDPLKNFYEKNIKTQDKAIEINPQNSTVWTNKGIDLGLSGKSEESIIADDKAIGSNPHN